VFVENYVFVHDGSDAYDPWITLAAIALATERCKPYVGCASSSEGGDQVVAVQAERSG